MAIHPTAIVDPRAEVDPSCEIGPYAIVGPEVKLGPENVIGAHAVLDGDLTMGRGNRVFPHACLGQIPQDLKWKNEKTRVVIGDRCQFREFTTVHRGTEGGGGVTRLGSSILMMANSHVAHDCTVGDHSILANSVALGGHVTLEDHVILGGLSAVHQFGRVGRFAFASGGSMVIQDAAPYCTVQGDRAQVAGLNIVGLQRNGFTEEQVGRVKAAYRIVFRSGTPLREAIAQLEAEYPGAPEIQHLVAWLKGVGDRGLVR